MDQVNNHGSHGKRAKLTVGMICGLALLAGMALLTHRIATGDNKQLVTESLLVPESEDRSDLARASLAGFDNKDYDALAGCFIKANAATKNVGQFYSATSTVEACAKACYEERTCLSFHHKGQVCKLSINPELKTTSASTVIEYGGLCPKVRSSYKQADGTSIKILGSILQCERNTDRVCRFPFRLAGETKWQCVAKGGVPVCPTENPTGNNQMLEYPDTSSSDFRPCGKCPDCILDGVEYNGHGLTNRQGMNTYSGLEKEECQQLCNITSGCNFFNYNTDQKNCFLKFGVGRITTGGSSLAALGPKTCPVTCGVEAAASCSNCREKSIGHWCGGDCQLQRKTCKAKKDLVAGSWGPWGTLQPCNGSDAQQTQVRTCSRPLGRDCTGEEEKKTPCSVDGGWSLWPVDGGWGTCNKNGDNKKRRQRSCDNPPPLNCGAFCTGDAKEEMECQLPSDGPKIIRLHVNTTICLRYASTEVESLVKNPKLDEQEVTFQLNLPENAFIHYFSMQTGSETYVAKVETKEEARNKFTHAKERGIGAGIVSRENEDSAVFVVNTTVPANTEVLFKLTYQEELQRKEGRYTYHLDLDLEKDVDDMKIEVHINETLPLLNCNKKKLTSKIPARGAVQEVSEKESGVCSYIYKPDILQQVQSREKDLGGQFAVQYEVDMPDGIGEILAFNGFFAHMFEDPPGLEPLPKYTIFILDVSGSMGSGRKFGTYLEQVQEAMYKIIDDMRTKDYFSIITFNNNAKVWSPSTTVRKLRKDQRSSSWDILDAHPKNKRAAKGFIESLTPGGGTNIMKALERGLDLAKETKTNALRFDDKMTDQIMFLTDGQSSIKFKTLQQKNSDRLPIYSLAYGRYARFYELKKLSEDSGAKAKLIYYDGDAEKQLKLFYDTIASPIITNLTFTYDGIGQSLLNPAKQRLEMGSSTTTVKRVPTATTSFIANAQGVASTSNNYATSKNVTMSTGPNKYQDFLQRLYAHATINKLSKEARDNDGKFEEDAALQVVALALHYNFVTPLTSLVVTSKDPLKTLVLTSGNLGVDSNFAVEEKSRANDGELKPACTDPSTLTLFFGYDLTGSSQTIRHTDRNQNLAHFNFDDKAGSLTVEGSINSCWRVYEREHLSGDWKMFGPGNYSMFGLSSILKDASSVYCLPCTAV